MTISLTVSVFVMLVGLIILCVQRRFNEIFWGLFLGGLIAVLIQLGGAAALRLG